MPDLLKLYHALPHPLQTAAANMRGRQLRAWRYDEQTDELADKARKREYWEPEKWERWQQKRLKFILQRAATQVPYYREYWRKNADINKSWLDLNNWPVLEKETIRKDPYAFLATDCDPKTMFPEHTSGTSGKPLHLFWSRSTVRHWYALFDARWRRWYGVSRHSKWACVGGQMIIPVSRKKPPYWVWNSALNQLYLSSYHLSPSNIAAYVDALKRYKIEYVYGYTSSLYAIAQEILASKLDCFPCKVAITNAEPVYEYQRSVIEEAFQCPLRETYGMAEIVAAASECENRKLHLWPEVGITEIFEGDAPAPPGKTGDLVCTGLFNSDMPFIRYRIGDRGSLAPPQESCSCGRKLPILEKIEGRNDDIIHTKDGRKIGRLDPIFKADIPIKEAQIIQESLERIRLKYVPDQNFGEREAEKIIKRIQDRLGPVTVILDPVETIPKMPNGKFRAVVSNLDSPGEIRS